MSFVETLKGTLAERRQARRDRKALGRELAGYSSATDRLELELMIARYPEEQTRSIREVLVRNDLTA